MAGKYRDLWYNVCKYGFSWMPDILYHNTIGWIMHRRFDVEYHWMNITNPKTFSEKIQFLKTHPVVDNEAELADKYDVRAFVARKIGPQFLIPLIGKGVYNCPDEIEWDLLPNQFVLKLTKGSGYNIICNDKSQLNKEATLKKLRSWLKIKPYYMSRERQYIGSNRIVCEKMLDYNITDYKFFCFDGKPTFVEVYADRQGQHKKAFFDMQWNCAGFMTANDKQALNIKQPAQFEEMRHIAEKLSEGMAFVRIDLYLHEDEVYFGEITFHPAGGYTPITPHEMDVKLGEMIRIKR